MGGGGVLSTRVEYFTERINAIYGRMRERARGATIGRAGIYNAVPRTWKGVEGGAILRNVSATCVCVDLGSARTRSTAAYIAKSAAVSLSLSLCGLSVYLHLPTSIIDFHQIPTLIYILVNLI